MNLAARFAMLWPPVVFVLCWSSGPIFSRWGLDHGSSFAILIGRYAVALAFLSLFCIQAKRFMPPVGKRLATAVTGFLLVGVYTICYLLALANHITPGVLSTVMGIQPILTLWLLERNSFSAQRLVGLFIALGGLILVVFQSLTSSELTFVGMLYALGALACISTGSIFQKRLNLAPMDCLPLQYLVSLILCLLFIPIQPFHYELNAGFIIPVLWLGLIISGVAQLLLYRLIRSGNLVNVTSLLYLVPGTTVIMDYIFLGNTLSMQNLIGMLAIICGLIIVFRVKRPA
ncbi:MAG: DMT family transporter [Deltaproteobacteria bacterium]|jgi:drug/metabolite transporter (DMT)-like permease|nr:DMT family transporter [Deltaproteobacteria bacterium]